MSSVPGYEFARRRRQAARTGAVALTAMLCLSSCALDEDAKNVEPAEPSGGVTTASPQPTTSTPTGTLSSPDPSSPSGEAPSPGPANREGEQQEDQADDRGRVRVLRSGAEGAVVLKLQRRLEKLGYWVGPRDGIYGFLTEQAVFAFQGAEGLARDGIVGPATRKALTGAARVRPRDATGNHIEIDETRGILIVVRGGSARWVFHTSTGTEQPYEHPNGETYVADTPNGAWSFTWQVNGWRDGRLGRMWRPKYFHEDGIAIHGYPVVPAYPASHGCARVSMDAIDFIWQHDLAPLGSHILVYGRG